MLRATQAGRLRRVGILGGVMLFVCASIVNAGAPGRTAQADLARRILEVTGVKGGVIVHLGCGGGGLTAALRASDAYLVHGLDPDAADVRQAREHIQSLGLYGPVSVDRLSGPRLPYADNFVNLIVAEEPGAVPMDELLRVLCPSGVAYVKRNGDWETTVKPRPKGIDEWTHWLHGADGNAVARDEVAGPPRGLQWIAGPLWSRHHNTVPSVSAMVSAGGRVFAIVDEAPPGMHGDAPDKWGLVARDAFNGVLLWRIPLAEWGWRAWSADWQCRFTTPTHVARRLVAAGDRVYATLGFNAPLSEIDAATGEVLRVFEDTRFTDEILCQDGLLILSINKGPQKPGLPTSERRGETDEPPVRKWVAAVDRQTGRMLWKTGDYVGLRSKTGSMERISHLTLAAGDNRIFFIDRERIVCLEMESGRPVWQAPRPEVPEHKMRYDIRITDMCSLVYHDGVLLFAQLDPDRRIDWRQVRGKVHAFSAETGEALWNRPCASWGWGHPADVFAVDGLVWVHDFETPYLLGLEPATGEVKRKTSNFEAFDNGHHHRCYRNKATSRYLMTSYRGLEFIPWDEGETHLNHWVRGTCRLGAFPCNGLIYAPPHPCDCYISSKLNGFLALGPVSGERGGEPIGPRLVRGPAYGKARRDQPPAGEADWPTYRHDPRRSGTTPAPVGPKLEPVWQASVGGGPSACTVAEGKVFVASVGTHEVCAFGASDGKPIWRFTLGGPVDSPPTVHNGRAIVGCTDGYVYCLEASDGQLAWRVRVAPRDRLVGAFGQLESAWPVHGSVLVKNDRVYAVAGRSSFLDGGIYACCLDARTGAVLSEETIRTPYTMPVDEGRNQSKDYGALPDVLVEDGNLLYMRGIRVFGAGEEEQPPGVPLRSTAGLLDDSWFNRTHWFVDGKPQGELLICDAATVYGVRAYATLNINAGFFTPGAAGYELFAKDRKPPSRARPAGDGSAVRKRPSNPAPRWSVRVPVRIVGMVLAGPTLFVAGTPDVLEPDDPWAAYEGRRGGVLMAFSAADGSKLAQRQLDSPPVFDGLAAAGGRLYVPTRDGHVLCFAGREPGPD